MQVSARNQLSGTVTAVVTDGVMAEVSVNVGGNEIVAAITRSSVDRLAIAVGTQVTVVIKATEVMIATE